MTADAARTMHCVGQRLRRYPVQAHSYDEVEAFQQLATGLVINVGTLTPDWVASMELAAKTANKLGKPWVLDPVGAGATPFRTQARHVTCSLTDLCCLVSG